MPSGLRLADVLRVARQIESPKGRESDGDRHLDLYLHDPRRTSLSVDGCHAIDDAVRAVGCGLSASAVTLAWNALIDLLHDRAGEDDFVAISSHVSVKGGVRNREQARDVMDGSFIEACHAGGLIRNADKRLLLGMLNERNIASHPGNRWVSRNFALQFIERVLTHAARLNPPK